MTATAQRRDQPEAVANVLSDRTLFGVGHPYGHPVDGLERTVRPSRGHARGFHQANWRPNNATLVLAGRSTPLRARLERAFGAWRPAPRDPASPPAFPARPRLVMVNRPGAPQSIIRIVGPGSSARRPTGRRWARSTRSWAAASRAASTSTCASKRDIPTARDRASASIAAPDRSRRVRRCSPNARAGRKPGSVPALPPVVVIPLGRPLPDGSCDQLEIESTRATPAGCPAISDRSCSRWGLPCPPRHRGRGALLPHRFTLTAALRRRRSIFCCTVLRVTPTGR